jgi:hypothetical protein
MIIMKFFEPLLSHVVSLGKMPLSLQSIGIHNLCMFMVLFSVELDKLNDYHEVF